MKRSLVDRSSTTSTVEESDTESENESARPSAHSSASTSSSKKRRTAKHVIGYDSLWEREFSWLQPVTDETGKVTGMLCRLCKLHKSKGKYNHSSVWSENPCTYLRKDSVRRHNSSQQHKGAVEKQSLLEASSSDGGITQAFQRGLTLKKSAVKGAMQCLYWLVKSEIPHTTNYNSLLKAVQHMGCDKLKHLNQGDNAKYTSQRIIQEFLQIIGSSLEQQQLQNLHLSPFFSLMIDETTDVSVLNELVIYARYITPSADVKTSFMSITALFNGTAETIEKAVATFLDDKDLSLSKMVGFATDGANVMTGRLNGVSTLLKRKQPTLTTIHCLAHRLALAAAQSGSKVAYINNTFKPTLSQLFYFYENSSVRMSGLKAIEQLLQTPELKLKKAGDTRWLSHDLACQSLMKVLPAVIASLEREAQERGDALAHGLYKVVRNYNFVATLYMMNDVLPIVSRLSRTLQTSELDLSVLHGLVTSTTETLQQLVDNPGVYMKKLDSDIDSSLSDFGVSHTTESKERFKRAIQNPFVSTLISNIKERLPDTGIFAAFSFLDPVKLPDTAEKAREDNYGENCIQLLGNHYGMGEAPIINKDELLGEWHSLRVYMINECRSKSLKEMLKILAKQTSTLALAHPNIAILAQVCITLPITTCDCERAFSTMRRVKSRLRSEMKNSTLNDCMRVSIEGPDMEDFNFDSCVDAWSKLKNRRISL